METIQSPKNVKARKKHSCMWCGDVIKSGSMYVRGVFKYDGIIYAWINHIHCSKIADELEMFENADEGVSEDYFRESINQAYHSYMAKNYPLLYDSEDFRIPNFLVQLKQLCQHYKIEMS